ncbi:MAG: hypothetical protein PHV66_02555, partial [Bacteroidales bacterium]|nr:hypothetical protein [Bacteroidales bacterium]
MKKLLVLLLMLTPVFAKANPINAGIYLSEISFDQSGDWSLEICSIDSTIYYGNVYIQTCSGTAQITNFESGQKFGIYKYEYIVITNKNLSKSLTINKDYDCVKLIADFVIDPKIVRIGDYPGSYLHNIAYGQSVACLNEFYLFYKDNTPTIGAANDMNGVAVGQIYGQIYGLNDQLIANKYFWIDGSIICGLEYINEQGQYRAKLESRSH